MQWFFLNADFIERSILKKNADITNTKCMVFKLYFQMYNPIPDF